MAGYGGSLSGEHGDGRARSELLPLMYSPAVIGLFERVKALFDPDDVLNPGVLVRPARLDDDVRMADAPVVRTGLALAYRHDGGDFSAAVHRCTGVGKCRADLASAGGVMCPSWPATREEKDTTRGRARVLQEMLAPGGPVRDWRSPEVHAALDLCLSCKGCSRDCPTGVDMASYKAEVLHQSYRRRLRPLSHYTLGRLPFWADLAARAPRLVNAVLASRLGRAASRSGRRAWTSAARCRRSRGAPSGRSGPTGRRRPARARRWPSGWTRSPTTSPRRSRTPSRRVLEAAGYRVQVPGDDTCCGLTWITTGQLDTARKILGARSRRWRPWWTPGSRSSGSNRRARRRCAGEALEVVGGPAAERVARGTRTLAELLAATPGWTPPTWTAWRSSPSRTATTRRCSAGRPTPRCSRRPAPTVTRLGGCCGLAGNWGVERGHHDVSVTIAEQQLLPAVRDLGSGRRRAGRRVLLPHPARPARRPPRSCTSPSSWPGRSTEQRQAAASRSRRACAAARTVGASAAAMRA